MLKTGVQPIVRVLLDRHGQLYSEAIGIDMRKVTALVRVELGGHAEEVLSEAGEL